MVPLVRRIAVVLACYLAILLVFQRLLTRDERLGDRFTLRVTQTDGRGGREQWTFRVGHFGRTSIDGTPASVDDAVSRAAGAAGALLLEGADANGRTWSASRDAEGRFDRQGQPWSLEQLRGELAAAAAPDPQMTPTRPVTILDVLEANIPMPTRSRVSFPRLSYRQAFPEANDEPEIVITAFHQAPMLEHMDDPNHMPPAWRGHYPQRLPPVEDRLPVNPAVVVGPDGIGKYGGAWRRCATSIWDLTRKVCYESFTRHDPSGDIQPCLAYKWEVGPDSRVFTFHLRKGHRWSDGQPFTTADILWVCRDQYGLGYPSDPPDWMQATDGALLLYEDDVEDWRELAATIVRQAASPEPSVGRQIRSLASEATWRDIEAIAAARADEDAAGRLAAELNELFRDRRLGSMEAWRPVDVGSDLQAIQRTGASRLDNAGLHQLMVLLERADLLRRFRADPASLQPTEMNRLNLAMFRAAYRPLVQPARRLGVRIEAVPDANGDDSHIIRFTFRKPNAIFLEQTTTFMFYRGLFNTPRHAVAPLHPVGWDKLAVTDVLEWEKLFATILRQAGSAEPSPGKRLWDLLEESVRTRIQADPPRDDSPPVYKQQLVDAVNAVLDRPGYYAPQNWPGFDIEALKSRAHANEGFARLSRDAAAMEEYRDLLILEDLRRRLEAEGPGSLGPKEHLKLNLLMFRAAYSADGDRAPVARTRTAGLTVDASKHPRKYTSWWARIVDRDNYHPVYAPHIPVLFAWRMVSEKDAQDIYAVRNPYYYRVDAAGNQLPYIDAIRTTISPQKEVRILKMLGGNVDCQSRDVTLDEFTALKQGEKRGGYEARLWANDYCGEVTFYCLQAHKDPMYRKLQEDPNFRYALSLALNRREIIDVVFMGLGEPAQFSVPEGSPYYTPQQTLAFAEYDPARANRLLDAMGLDRRAKDGTRLLWDGRPLIMDVNVVPEVVPLPAIRLACQYWQDIGVNAQMKIRTGRMIYRLEELGLLDIAAHKEGGNFFGPLLPGCYYPSHQAEAVQWYQWAWYIRSGGRHGWPAPERIKELERMWQKLVTSPDPQAKMAAWRAITDRFIRDLPIIAVMTSPGKIIYVRNNFKNVPRIAMAGWIAHEPGNSCPESFYFDDASPSRP